ncbi:hypothetical protein CHS0354_025838 [Potamilus streckersoni]|uniref:Transposase n=1 Tax=Potamilus streckersoni TaxID=2493646 RepID=A0AAE0SBA3_9BIVA|nr:hypothetical protein CHS0354_025838 [Potamilus streckersoni]
MEEEVDCCLGCNMNKRKRSSSAIIDRPITTDSEATSGTAAKKKRNIKKIKKKPVPGLSEVLQNVLYWFETEKAQGAARLLRTPKRRLAKATKLSYAVIKRRLDELDPVQKVVKSLVKKEEHHHPNKKFSSAEEEWVGKIVLDLQSKFQSASIKHLKTVLKEKGVDASHSTIRKVLDKQGFRYCWKDKCWECVPILKGKRLSHKKDNVNTNAEEEEEEEEDYDDDDDDDDDDEEDDDNFLESEDGTFIDMEDGASVDS